MNQHPTVDPTLVRDSLSQRSSIPATSAVTTTTTTPSAMSEKTNASMLRRLSPHPRAHNTSTTNAARLGLNPLKPIPHQAMGEVERPRIEPLLSTPPSTLQESLEKIKQTQLDHQRVLHSILWDLAMIKSEARCCSRKRARDQDADCDITTIENDVTACADSLARVNENLPRLRPSGIAPTQTSAGPPSKRPHIQQQQQELKPRDNFTTTTTTTTTRIKRDPGLVSREESVADSDDSSSFLPDEETQGESPVAREKPNSNRYHRSVKIEETLSPDHVISIGKAGEDTIPSKGFRGYMIETIGGSKRLKCSVCKKLWPVRYMSRWRTVHEEIVRDKAVPLQVRVVDLENYLRCSDCGPKRIVID